MIKLNKSLVEQDPTTPTSPQSQAKRAKKVVLPGLELTERRYQKELCEKALNENVIIYLGTGLGKTFITVLYLREIYYKIKDGLHVVFIAPTQDLTRQQSEYFRKHLQLYRQNVYSGRSVKGQLHIDRWQADTWSGELKRYDVLFMTPQIFANALQHGFLNWESFAAIIFDECHWASRKKGAPSSHPYSSILLHYKGYYNCKTSSTPRPRIIGLTASLINNQPSKRTDISQELSWLEKDYSARCVTDFVVSDKRPTMVLQSFSATLLGETHKLFAFFDRCSRRLELALDTRKLLKIRQRADFNISAEDEKLHKFGRWMAMAMSGFSIKPSKFPKVFSGLGKILERCGLWQFNRMCAKIVEALERPIGSSYNMPETKAIYLTLQALLKKILNETTRVLQLLPNNGLEQCRSKPYSLLDALEVEHQRMLTHPEVKETFSCIVFVKSRLEVVAVQSWLHEVSQKISRYNFIKSDYAVGLAASGSSTYAFLTKTTPSAQAVKLDKFRKGLLNVIVTTSVLEEGIDLPICSTVIRYDPPWNFREFVQSRGRARQEKSSFIVLSEDFNKSEIGLNAYYDFELTIQNSLKDRDIGSASRHSAARTDYIPRSSGSSNQHEDVFVLRNGEIRIDATSAKVILHMYCAFIQKRRLFVDPPTYGRDYPSAGTCQTTLYMPSECPISGGIKGGVRSSEAAADGSACVATVRALYDAKELDEHAVPFRLNEKSIDQAIKDMGFDCEIELLDKDLEGIRERVGDKEVFYFPSKMSSLQAKSYNNSGERRYKMIGLSFVSANQNNRQDARNFLEQIKYGLIVEDFVSEDFLPERIHGHYGEYKINSEILVDSFCFNDTQVFNDLLRHTHRLLAYCLGLRNVDFLSLKQHSLFLIVPLNSQKQLSFARLRESFGWPRNRPIRQGDVVRVKVSGEKAVTQRRDFKDFNRLMYVKSYCTHLTPASQVPGTRKTFIELAQRDSNFRVRPDQRIIEVVPISREIAKLKAGKLTTREQTTASVFFLEDLLEHFDSDPASVFQAFNLPIPLYKLFQNLEATDLDDLFVEATKDRRETMRVEPEKPLVLFGQANREAGDESLIECVDKVDYLELDVGEEQEEVMEDDSSDAAEPLEDDDTYSDRDESEEDLDSHDDAGTLEEILNRTDKSGLKRWDISEYVKTMGIEDLKKLNFDYRHPPHRDMPDIYAESSLFGPLEQELGGLLNDLIGQLENLKKESANAGLDGENDKELVTMKINLVDPPFSLDRRPNPFKIGSRVDGVLEALTLRRAGDSYNLEGLETIGDSYLKYATSVVLFKRADVKEGLLTSIRSRLTCNNYFTYLAKKSRLGSYAITQGFSPELLSSIIGRDRNHRVDKRSMNKMRTKELADVFEALVGAYLVYQSEYEAVLFIQWLGLKIFDLEAFDEFHEKAVVFARVPSPLAPQDGVDEIFRRSRERLGQFESIICYTFNDKAFALQAFSHSSALHHCTASYERLEFLGDAILDYLVVLTLYSHGSMNDPGQLTSSKSAIVNNYTFARLALKYNFHQFIDHACVDLHVELSRVQDELEDDPSMKFLDMVDYDKIVKLLADSFESVAGAIYLDSGCSLDAVWRVYYSILKDTIDQELSAPTKNLTQVLYETFVGGITFEEFGDNRDTDLKCIRLHIANYGEFEGRGNNKKHAKMRAIQKALKNPVTSEVIEQRRKEYAQQATRPSRQNRPPVRNGSRPSSQQRGHSQQRAHSQQRNNSQQRPQSRSRYPSACRR